MYTGSAKRRLNGQIPKIPIMIGTNSQEGRVFVRGQNDLRVYVQKTFDAPKLQKEILKAYPVGRREFATGFDAIAQIVTEFGHQCVCSPLSSMSEF